MNAKAFVSAIKQLQIGHTRVESKTIKQLIKNYPYCTLAHFLHVRALYNTEDMFFEDALKTTALHTPCRRNLYQLLQSKPKPTAQKDTELETLYQEAKSQFFANKETNSEKESAINPTLSYEKEIRSTIIEKFLKENPAISKPKVEFYKPSEAAKKSLEESDDLISETLARIYAEQKNYTKAIATYHKLMLKFPKKNRYFASQIEKLENLSNKK